MSRRHRNGKQVSGMEMGFIICQAVAGMMLFGILMVYISAKLTFEKGVEYLPVTITWTDSESHVRTYMKDGKKRMETTYDNSYRYIVDGVEYNHTVDGSSYGVTPGSTDIRYYNPNNPNQISAWSSAEEMMKSTVHVWVLFIIFQIPAVFFKIKIEQKKHLIKADHKAYEEKIRQDIQKNKEIYRTLNLAIDKEKIFAVLEPLRIGICQNQKKVDRIMKRADVQVGGIFIPVTIAVKIIDSYRLRKLKDKLDMDHAAFYMEYKRNIAEPILERFFGEFQYKPSQGLSKNELLGFKFLKGVNMNAVHSEDYIEGIYKGVGYRQADVQREKRLDASDLYNEIDRLHGRISIYEFKKSLNGDIVIKSKNSPHVDVGSLAKVEMENIQFNDRFDVYAANGQMAYYLLTPQFMEYLLQLDVRRETAFRFSTNHIYVLRNGINGVFEVDMSKPLDLQYEIGKSYNELQEILDFVDVLNLDKVAEQANLRAVYSMEEDTEPSVVQDDESPYGVVDMEDSIFGGPAFEEAEMETDMSGNDDLENWNKPASSQTGSGGLRLKL